MGHRRRAKGQTAWRRDEQQKEWGSHSCLLDIRGGPTHKCPSWILHLQVSSSWGSRHGSIIQTSHVGVRNLSAQATAAAPCGSFCPVFFLVFAKSQPSGHIAVDHGHRCCLPKKNDRRLDVVAKQREWGRTRFSATAASTNA